MRSHASFAAPPGSQRRSETACSGGLAAPGTGGNREVKFSMVNRNLLREYELPEDQFRQELDAAFNHGGDDWLPAEAQEFRDQKIVSGRVRKVTADEVWVDVGYKS